MNDAAPAASADAAPYAARSPVPSPGQRQKVLFIGGVGRSGSTLIERLLNELPQTFAVGETIHLWERGLARRERCGCGQPFDSCVHWSAVGREAFGDWANVDLDDVIGLRWSVDRTRRLGSISLAHRRQRPGSAQARYLAYLRAVLLASAAVAGQPEVLLESSKHLSTGALLALDPALDVRLLHLVRDPRGVAYSWTKQVARPETGGELMPRYHPARTAGRWVADNLGFEVLARRIPSLRLRYEDFLAAPAYWLAQIGQLVDLDPRQMELSFLHGPTVHLSAPMHSVAGNPLRFASADVTLAVDDAWREKLGRRDRWLVTAATAPLLATYGYSALD
jgi:hypothetical protein